MRYRLHLSRRILYIYLNQQGTEHEHCIGDRIDFKALPPDLWIRRFNHIKIY